MLRDNALEGQVIIVTGGGSGLGKAMTTYFLQLGAKTVITSRNLEKLKKTSEELEELTGGEVLPVACDVRHYDQVEAMLASALEKISRRTETRTIRGSAATSHMWIVNPFRGNWFSNMFSTHPPVEERIRRLTRMEGEAK